MPDDMDELIPEIPIGEEHVEKFMQELYKVMTTPAGSDTSVEHPSWTAAGYAATGWESESCGAAVSDSASSVMAGVEYAGKLLLGAEREERSTAAESVGPRTIGKWTVRMRRSGLRG
ncbi:hypothetical protein ACLB2K_024655 [Fragaria x ananassa]